MEDINIALATDNNYAIGCGVVIHSVFKNLDKKTNAVIHILYTDLNSDNKARIECIARQIGGKLRWHYLGNDISDIFDFETPRWYSKETFFRLLLPKILPEVNEILYLDVDLLVRTDVSVLFQNHTSSLIRACLDMYLPMAKQQVLNFERYGLKGDDLVVNTGVCLLNLREIRKTALIEKSIQLLVEHTEDMSYIDQTAINIAFKGNIDFLPTEWNVFPQCIEKRWISPVESIQPFASDVLNNPKIVHFVGGSKPWHRSNNLSFSDEWRTDLYNSGWFRSEIELFVWVLKNRWNKKTLWQIWKWRSI